jgi:hypothetical protein
MSFMLTAEVLHGLGLRGGTGPARFTLQKPVRLRPPSRSHRSRRRGTCA